VVSNLSVHAGPAGRTERLGRTRSAVFEGLRKALKTSHAVRHQAGLEFVVAPELAGDGQPVRRFTAKYAAAVYPLLAGLTGGFGEQLPDPAAAQLIDLLATLHQVPAGPRWQGPVADPALALRGELAAGAADQAGGQAPSGRPISHS